MSFPLSMPIAGPMSYPIAQYEGGAWWLSGSVLDLDFANRRGYNSIATTASTPDSILTYTSPSPKLVYGDDGVLGYAPHNLLPYSEQFDNVAWSKSNSTVSANAIVAPDGTTTADKIVENTATGGHSAYASVSLTSGFVYTFSVYLKKGERTYAAVQIYDSVTRYRLFNLDNGTEGASSNITSSAIEDVGNGWYRCSISYTGTYTGTCYPYVFLLSSSVYAGYTGDGTSGLYAWGAQLSRGSTLFDYIPTTSAAVYSLPIDHNPTTFDPLGVLIEEQRVNLLTYSQEFDNAAWVKTDTTVTANAATAPDGTTTADLFTDGAAGTLATSLSVSVANPLTLSVYMKYGNTDWFLLQIGGSGTERIRGWFNLSTGVVGSTEVIAPGASASLSMEDCGGGWYRCILTGTLNGAGSACAVLMASTNANLSSIRVNGATRYQWGAQLE